MAKSGKLIELVRNFPILYDSSHEDYKNVRKKDKIWLEIGKQLNENGDDVKRKWKNLKDTYAKFIKSSKAGQGANNTKKWLWADQMNFLTVFDVDYEYSSIPTGLITSQTNIKSESLSSIVTEDIEDAKSFPTSKDDSQVNETQIAFSTPSPEPSTILAPTRPRQRKIFRKRSEPSSSVGNLTDYFQNKNKTSFDAIDSLFLAHAKTVKTFSARRQAIAKMNIAQVIMEQELMHLDEVASANSTSQQ